MSGAALSLALAVPSWAATAPNIPCGPTSARTLASDGVARVYARDKHVYGCAASDQRSFRLGEVARGSDRKRVGPLALAGVDAAYGMTTSGVDTISVEIVVSRLSDGHVVHHSNAITGPLPGEFYERVFAVVVKDDGSVAWTAQAGSIISHKAPERQVEKIDHTGRTLLDGHRQIGLRSLRLTGSELTWRDGSATRSATLQ